MSIRNLIFAIILVLHACESGRVKPSLKKPKGHISTHQAVDSLLSTLRTVKYKDLDSEYVHYAEMDGAFKNYYTGKTFYLIGKEDLYKPLVGKHRIIDFLPDDTGYKARQYFRGAPVEQPLMLEKSVLYKFVDLLDMLREQGYKEDAMKVYHGFRHPRNNREVGGASVSVHMRGLAIDIRIFDINRDGEINWDDKVVVIDMLDKHIIKDQGGIGRYPHSQGVHFDVRGYMARWDTY